MEPVTPLDGGTPFTLNEDLFTFTGSNGLSKGKSLINKKRKIDSTVSVSSEEDESMVCIITRVDKKVIPFNFYNNTKSKWKIIPHLDIASLTRNKKGTVIKENILPGNLTKFNEDNDKFSHNSIEYEAHLPRKYTPFIGELTLNMMDMEDRSILTHSDEEIITSLQSSSSNHILSISRIYPRNCVTQEEALEINLMKISIEFQNHIPERVSFQHLSMPITPYIRPPTRCFTCQRYGHSSISCIRKTQCNNCGGDHFHKGCIIDANLFKCLHCSKNHRASSVQCAFYKGAMKIAALLQHLKITHSQASEMFARLYSGQKQGVPQQSYEAPSQTNPVQNIPTSSADFPNLPKSQIIKTRRRPTPKTKPSSPEEEPVDPTELLSQEQDSNEPSLPIPPWQISKSRPQGKTPRHQTEDYIGILDGSLWQANPLAINFLSDDSDDLLDLGPTREERRKRQKEDKTKKSSPTSENIWEIVKGLITKVVHWVKTKIETLLGSNTLKNLLSSGLSSMFASFA